MIYGIGTDLCDIRRIRATLARRGERFAEKVLGPHELAVFRERHAKVAARGEAYLATRFAAKEAFSKAMGTGFRYPVTLQCISVVQNKAGKPGLAFHPNLERLVTDRGIVSHHLTISDESSLACACVVLEAA